MIEDTTKELGDDKLQTAQMMDGEAGNEGGVETGAESRMFCM